jgi:hypothetical protein
MRITSVLRLLAVLVFALATLRIAPVPMTPLGLALWCASTLAAKDVRTLILATSIRAAGGLVAAAAAGRFSEDVGTRLRRESESNFAAGAAEACIITRAGLR